MSEALGAGIRPRLAAHPCICMLFFHAVFDDCLSFHPGKPWDDRGLGKPPETMSWYLAAGKQLLEVRVWRAGACQPEFTLASVGVPRQSDLEPDGLDLPGQRDHSQHPAC